MKWTDEGTGSKAEFLKYLREMVSKLESGHLTLEGQTVEFPSGVDLEYKVKYDVDEEEGSLSFKVTWPNA